MIVRLFAYKIHFNKMFESDSGCRAILCCGNCPTEKAGRLRPPAHMLLIAAPNQALEQPEMPRTFPRSPSGDAPWRRTLLILSLAGTTRWMKLAGVGGWASTDPRQTAVQLGTPTGRSGLSLDLSQNYDSGKQTGIQLHTCIPQVCQCGAEEFQLANLQEGLASGHLSPLPVTLGFLFRESRNELPKHSK